MIKLVENGGITEMPKGIRSWNDIFENYRIKKSITYQNFSLELTDEFCHSKGIRK
jgi:hypothetical protein